MMIRNRQTSRFNRHSGARGFTLIELMIAVLIIAIIAAIAYPSYLKEVRDSRRTTAITNLMNIASQIEKYYSTNNAYPASLTSLGYSANNYAVPAGSNPFYDITYGLNSSMTEFTLYASPQGDQSKDTECKAFSLNSLGEKKVSGTLKLTPSKCWGQ